jgi:hypothetical protein
MEVSMTGIFRSSRWLIAGLMLLAITVTMWPEPSVSLDSADLYLENMFPLGIYGEYVGISFGAGGQISVSIDRLRGALVFASCGYSYGGSRTVWVNAFHNITLIGGIAYKLPLRMPLSITPELGFGLIYHIATGDIDRDSSSDVTNWADAVGKLQIKVGYSLNENIMLFAAPVLSILFESESTGLEVGYQLGARIGL